jgi:uncharacterized protein (DUF427 family)
MTSFQPPPPFVEPTGRRVRVRLGDEIVAESDRAQLLVQYGPSGLPTYYLPEMDVVDGALIDESADGGNRTWTVQMGGKRAERAAWTHPDPSGALTALADHVTFSWRQLEWYEEDERVVMHARDPHHRVDTLRSSRRVQVLAGGQVVASGRCCCLRRPCRPATTCHSRTCAPSSSKRARRRRSARTRAVPATGRSGSRTPSSRTLRGVTPTPSRRTRRSATWSRSFRSGWTLWLTAKDSHGPPRRGRDR